MKTTAELVTTIGKLTRGIEQASAKGFVTDDSLILLDQLKSSVDGLVALATSEFWAANRGEAR